MKRITVPGDSGALILRVSDMSVVGFVAMNHDVTVVSNVTSDMIDDLYGYLGNSDDFDENSDFDSMEDGGVSLSRL